MAPETIKLLKLLARMTTYKGFSNRIQEIIIHDTPTYSDESSKEDFVPNENEPNFQSFEIYVQDLIEKITKDSKYKIKSLAIKGLRDYDNGNPSGINRGLLDFAVENLGNPSNLIFNNQIIFV